MSADKAPWWVTAGLKFGVGAVLAFYFVHWITTDISATLRSIDARLAEQVTIEKLERRRVADMLQIICENSADSQQGRNLCAAVARAFPE